MRTLLLAALLTTLGVTDALAQRGRPDRAPEVGAQAPDFELVQLDQDGNPSQSASKVKLFSFRGDRPVALVFGSYT